ncbi:CRISPR-associated endonuclease/helicase Cas3 [Desulfatibacillum alkenivorans DSM 16219]|jgi:CRISPR-associated endonuclease/helicase Cas3|uniref:CRISPR-associated endonuclease/helicase Cas3 n=1 Tax=Desulfatibacillum alkenivorans DSM 16219 TaxID=1121393 RepID=A0A1M6YB10_9BACT|nr:CRISPR-associated helicase/endonuclease Cas3 [Desulfatibacillum alkenivorans]SHL15418.1 CRISPR-associated endonuclease/helicase Cas3 [Desulfatibacillum alkenivorans DSM 16219]
MDNSMHLLWAKTAPDHSGQWHPLVLHLLDAAACAEAILDREPETAKQHMAACLGLPWDEARPWLLAVIACHDIGKACPGFQAKWTEAPPHGIATRRSINTRINHGYVSQIALESILLDLGWPYDLAELAAASVGCHHGQRASYSELQTVEFDRFAMGEDAWTEARKQIFQAILSVFNPVSPPSKETLSGPEFMLISGLTSFADWIGSNTEWFDYGTPLDCADLAAWYEKSKAKADSALDAIGWRLRTPLSAGFRTFPEVFGFPPRPLQEAVSVAVQDISGPSVLLLEAPMGEGKTEAAFYIHLEQQRKNKHRGLYIALPTKATGNAMFKRTMDFLRKQGCERPLDLQLLHGASILNEDFTNLKISDISDPHPGGEVRAGEWFTNKKRALLSEYGVGTVDQALLPILPVRHNFVRLWGLANRVVVFDEIHAYDSYTGTLLIHLVRWLLSLGSSIVLLSATLPPSIRRKLASGIGAQPPEGAPYPRLTVFSQGEAQQISFSTDPKRRQTIKVKGVQPDLSSVNQALAENLPAEGMGLVLMNTVGRAQEFFLSFPEGEPVKTQEALVGKRLQDGTEVYLFHARYPAVLRQKREDFLLKVFGKDGDRSGRKILIATQVVEQSLDLDFDYMITDLAPIDLLLQRAGRLWRHKRKSRPADAPILTIAGLTPGAPPDFKKPLWWSSVYGEDLLLKTWTLLASKKQIILPDEIDSLVTAVYEDHVQIPSHLAERLDQAVIEGEGEAFAKTGQANMAIIGLPDDDSWNDPSRFVLYDEDDPLVHRSLAARTRLGEESVSAIPLTALEKEHVLSTPSFSQAKELFFKTLSITRKSVVKQLKQCGVPDPWKKSPLLRNCFPMVLDEKGLWEHDAQVRLDEALGLLYQEKEDL